MPLYNFFFARFWRRLADPLEFHTSSGWCGWLHPLILAPHIPFPLPSQLIHIILAQSMTVGTVSLPRCAVVALGLSRCGACDPVGSSDAPLFRNPGSSSRPIAPHRRKPSHFRCHVPEIGPRFRTDKLTQLCHRVLPSWLLVLRIGSISVSFALCFCSTPVSVSFRSTRLVPSSRSSRRLLLSRLLFSVTVP